MITKVLFDQIPAGKVFAQGELPNTPEGLFMTDNDIGRTIRWVAVKGYGNDWAVYCHWAEHDAGFIERSGDKVTYEAHIKRCVPCDDEVFKLYRFN